MNGRSAAAWVIVALAAGTGAGLWLARRADDARAPHPEPVHEPLEELAAEPSSRRSLAARRVEPAEPAPSQSPWARLNGEAIDALEAGDLERAVELFERCHAAEPEERVFARNLAETLARRAVRDYAIERPCERCLRDLERALELAPDREDVARLLEQWKREHEVEKDFWREGSPHFDLAYDGSRVEVLHGAPRVLNLLEDNYVDLCQRFAVAPAGPDEPRISVVLYEREGFHSITGLGEWAGGSFDGVVRVPIGDFTREEQGLARVLRHELVHDFVARHGGKRVPGWLNEGLAQWLEPESSRAIDSARALVRGKAPIELDALRGSLAGVGDAERISQAYAQSLMLVDSLARRFGESFVFDLVRACAGDGAFEQHFERLARLSIGDAFEAFCREVGAAGF